ncbi:MAG: hypothetical protein ACYSTN_10360 [Planctomycetota bacterium]
MIASAEKRQLESATMIKYDEKFQFFVALGLALIICEAFINERRKTYDEKFQIFVALGLALIICEAFINERRKT